MLLTAFLGNVKGENYTWFPQESVYLASGAPQEYAQEIWWHSDAAGQHFALGANTYGDFEFTSEVISGDLEVTFLAGDNFTEGNQTKYGLKVKFTGSKGVIEITAANYGKYDGNTYICKYVLSYGGGSKKWDCNSKPIHPEYSHYGGADQNFSTTLSNFVSKEPSNHFYYYPYTRDEVLSYLKNQLDNGQLSIDDIMTTDFSNTNYFGVQEAEGLFFSFDKYNCGYNNGRYHPAAKGTNYPKDTGNDVVHPNGDENKDQNCYTRFIALKAGSLLIIPKEQFFGFGDHPRIRIKMNRDAAPNSEIDLNIYNAQDALGTKIVETDAYRIGGCGWWENYCLWRGEYHFIVDDPGKNFVIRIPNNDFNTSAAWLLLYSIEIYNSEELVSENSVLDKYQRYELLNTYKQTIGNNGQAGTYGLHYHGKNERTTITTNMNTGSDYRYWPTGTVTCNNSRISSDDNGLDHTYTSIVGEFGTFNLRIECRTVDKNAPEGVKPSNSGYSDHIGYCTDYATRSMAVGYLDKKSYPYTWDFTDVDGYKDGANRMGSGYNQSQWGEQDYYDYNRWEKRYHWEKKDGVYGHRLSKDATSYDKLYCRGSQLWYGRTLIPEIEGLGFSTKDLNGTYNSTLQILPTGLKINQENDKDWCYRMTIPEVPSTDVVYARVHPDRSDEYFNAGYSYGETNFKEGSVQEIRFSAEENNASKTLNTNDGSGDVIYVIPGDGTNLTLYFNGVTVKKIAVSEDPKTVNVKGWTTESRARVIDPELTSFMTGYVFKTYVVESANYADHTVTLTPIPSTEVMAKSAGVVNGMDDKNACIIFNTAGEEVDIINGGFHLFVPDMHDYMEVRNDGLTNQKSPRDLSNNMLRSILAAKQTLPTSCVIDGTNYTNYALSYKYYTISDDGTILDNNVNSGDEAFYRVAKNTSSSANKGYLPLPTASVKPNSGSTAPSFSIIFDDNNSGTEGINNTFVYDVRPQNNVYYNLNGQMINGVPSTPGLYIVNGKKVIIK